MERILIYRYPKLNYIQYTRERDTGSRSDHQVECSFYEISAPHLIAVHVENSSVCSFKPCILATLGFHGEITESVTYFSCFSPTCFIYREKFILEQEIREKEDSIRQQNSEVQVRLSSNHLQIVHL